MTQDQNKKTLRHFQCRDYLWEIFEQMSAELECSTDYLINEAMRQYARSRNYGTSQRAMVPEAGAAPAHGQPIQSQPLRPSTNPAAPMPQPAQPGYGSPASGAPAAPPVAPAAPAGGGQPIPSLRGTGDAPVSVPPPPRAPAHSAAPTTAPAPPGPSSRPVSMPPPPRPQTGNRAAYSAPPPLPGGRPQSSMPPSPGVPSQPHAAQQLYIIFNGQKIPVLKEEFVIGRGSKSADLPIKDGNISRRHAAVVLHNGVHYIKDLGSTNGIEYQGRRFESRRIEEGDVYRLCDYELQFTYH